MTHNFETNIEKRMPDTGKVFFVDRMTSDYATAHPFDVDGFIEQVYQKYEQMANEDAYACAMGWNKSREELRRMWTAVLSDNNPHGNASLYPNQNGPQPALMEVWHKAGDYWRSGLRIGDVLPAIVPACKITRFDNGEWIALFPKDMMLLDAASEECRAKSEKIATAVDCPEIVAVENTITDSTDDTDVPVINACEITASEDFGQILENFEPTGDHEPAEQNDAPPSSVAVAASDDAPAEEKSAVEKQEPVQLDLFAQMQKELTQLREENERLRSNMIQEQAAVCSPRHEEDCSCVRQEQPRRAARRSRQPLDVSTLYGARPSRTAQAAAAYPRFYNSSETSLTAESKHGHEWLKAVGIAATTVVALVVIFKTGLLIPLGLIGLGASGFLK